VGTTPVGGGWRPNVLCPICGSYDRERLTICILRIGVAAYEDFSITDPMDRERAFGQNDHVRIYAMDYVDRLKQAGFAVELFHWRRNNRDYGGQNNKFGLIDREIVFFASRPHHCRQDLELENSRLRKAVSDLTRCVEQC
jgi:hypothetical protein